MNQQRAEGRVAQTQARILDAAQELLVRHGARKVTITDIARAAGVGKGTAYQYWPSKEDVVIAVVARELARNLESVAARLHEDAALAAASRLAPMMIRTHAGSELLTQLQADPDVVVLLARHVGARALLDAASPLGLCTAVVHELRSHGLADTTQSEQAQAYVLHALLVGFGQATVDASSSALVGDPGQREALLSRTVHLALEASTQPGPTQVAHAAAGIQSHLQRALAALAPLHSPLPDRQA